MRSRSNTRKIDEGKTEDNAGLPGCQRGERIQPRILDQGVALGFDLYGPFRPQTIFLTTS